MNSSRVGTLTSNTSAGGFDYLNFENGGGGNGVRRLSLGGAIFVAKFRL